MKCITLFLVLSLVVLMAEPGECFLHHIFGGLIHIGRTIHGMIHSIGNAEQQQELEQRDFDRERASA